jgi:pimeloyl-ACP methyl ester carboxylesterase
VLLAAFTLWMLPPSRGKAAPVLDAQGRPLAGGIAEKVFVDIDGTRQGMFLRGEDRTKPVLLLLHGGPGMPDYFLARAHRSTLERRFVVCYWEQRGCGLSFAAGRDPAIMTVERFVQDVLAVTDALRARFGQDQIYLMGHSWGSYLGLLAVQRAPERYRAYIGMGQACDQPASERMAYTWMLERCAQLRNARLAGALRRTPIERADAPLEPYLNGMARDKAMHALGVGTMHAMRSVVTGILLPSLRCREYTPAQRIAIWRGKTSPLRLPLRQALYAFDALRDVPALQVPVYIWAGAHDLTTAYALQKAYFERLTAPRKGFYTFAASAHCPAWEEPELAALFAGDVLAGTVLQADGQPAAPRAL